MSGLRRTVRLERKQMPVQSKFWTGYALIKYVNILKIYLHSPHRRVCRKDQGMLPQPSSSMMWCIFTQNMTGKTPKNLFKKFWRRNYKRLILRQTVMLSESFTRKEHEVVASNKSGSSADDANISSSLIVDISFCSWMFTVPTKAAICVISSDESCAQDTLTRLKPRSPCPCSYN
jgi:hypothetical protein